MGNPQGRESVVLRTEKGAHAIPLLRVVLGGLASRQNLCLEALDDIQLAIETLVAEEQPGQEMLALEIWPGENGLAISLDGLTNSSVKKALLGQEAFEPSPDCPLDVRTILASLVDSFAVEQTGDACFAVHMDKRAA